MITREEYELLKHYHATGYGWIARDGDDEYVYVYKSKPRKLGLSWGTEHGCYQLFVDDDSLTFITWKDEEPTKILDLIRDYEAHQIITGGNNVNKSELIKEIEDILDDIGVSDYQLGECDEDTIWAISSIAIREILSEIEKYSIEKEKLYTVTLSNGSILIKDPEFNTFQLCKAPKELIEGYEYKLTQSEIESVDPRLMQFAEEVE